MGSKNGRTVDLLETRSGSGSIFFWATSLSNSLSIFVGCSGGFVESPALRIAGSNPGRDTLGLDKRAVELVNLTVIAGRVAGALIAESDLAEDRSRGFTLRNMVST